MGATIFDVDVLSCQVPAIAEASLCVLAATPDAARNAAESAMKADRPIYCMISPFDGIANDSFDGQNTDARFSNEKPTTTKRPSLLRFSEVPVIHCPQSERLQWVES